MDDPRIKYIISHLKGDVVLDVGCVGGDWRIGKLVRLSPLHHEIKRKKVNVVGIDRNKEGLKIMKHKNLENNLICADAYYLPFRNEIIDTVVAGELIEHLSSPGIFLDEAYRILRDNSVLVGDVPNAWDLEGIFQLLIFRRQPTPTRSTTHVHVFDDYTLKLLLLQHGFEAKVFYNLLKSRHTFGKIINMLQRIYYPKTTHWLSFIARKISRKRTETLLTEWIKQISPK